MKQKICTESPNQDNCEIDFSKSFKSNILTKNKELKVNEISALLSSSNFNDLIGEISVNNKSDTTSRSEQEYINEINNISNELSGVYQSRIACDDDLCALTVNVANETAWNNFKKQFFKKDTSKGNTFIRLGTPQNNETENRILFFPGNTNAIVQQK